MNSEAIIAGVYKEVGLSQPDVLTFRTIREALSSWRSWISRIGDFPAVVWSEQYPLLAPDSYWAQHVLYGEGFQFDVDRRVNGKGGLVLSEYRSKIGVSPAVLYQQYLTSAVEACSACQETEIDKCIDSILETEVAFLQSMEELMDSQLPDTPRHVEDYIFLGWGKWLAVEYSILCQMRRWLRRPVCESHFQNIRCIRDSSALFITFGGFVVAVDGVGGSNHPE